MSTLVLSNGELIDVPNDVPVIPPTPGRRRHVDPNPVVAVCGECGLELRQVMGYVCSRLACPTGMGPAWC